MKSDGLIDEIKARIDIHDLISEYVDLKRAGQNFKGLCPFHSEKTPSFMVNPSRQIFHCFGCNKGGDIFSFIMNYENMTFNEALSFLAGKAGVHVEADRRRDPKKSIKEALYSINEEAMRYFADCLKNARQALTYLEERGITSDVSEQFRLGYAKGERDALSKHLRAAGFSEEHIRSSGLVRPAEAGSHDFFRERVIFPIFDLRGKVIAFGGRTLSSSKSIPKYLNSPESPIFRKGESCYAINEAKNSIVQKGYSIIVEGYFDAIVCHKFGFANTVAPLGTALTQDHLKKLKKFANNVLLTFDADPAGIAAAKRTIELVYTEGMISKVVLLSEGEDPDTFLRKYGAGQFRNFIAKAMSPVRFFLSRAGKNRIDGVRQFLAILSSCRDQLLRDDALRELSDLVSEKVLRGELAALSSKPEGRRYRFDDSGPAAQNAVPRMPREEEILLNIAISFPRISRRIAERIDVADLEHPDSRSIFGKLLSMPDDSMSIANLLSECSEEEQAVITRHSINPSIDTDEISRNVDDCINKIMIKKINKKISEAKSTGDADALRTLLREKNSLTTKTVELFRSKDSK